MLVWGYVEGGKFWERKVGGAGVRDEILWRVTWERKICESGQQDRTKA
jgi:hypothetical protein